MVADGGVTGGGGAGGVVDIGDVVAAGAGGLGGALVGAHAKWQSSAGRTTVNGSATPMTISARPPTPAADEKTVERLMPSDPHIRFAEAGRRV